VNAQQAATPAIRNVNAARVYNNVVHYKLKIAALRRTDDVGLANDATRRCSLRNRRV
jgi:hypothetical protein